MRFRKKIVLILLITLISFISLIFIIFPGQQKTMAWSLMTGIGISDLQAQVDYLENKAINKKNFQETDIKFLKDLFLTMSTGAKYSLVYSESGKLTSHYLECTGKEYQLPTYLFNKNNRVRKKMIDLKNQLLIDIKENSIKWQLHKDQNG